MSLVAILDTNTVHEGNETMKVTIKGSELTICMNDFADSLDDKARGELLKHLCGQERLFGAILECLSSDDDSFFEGEWWFGKSTMLELREKLLPLMDDNARRAVRTALEQRNLALADSARHAKFAWDMYHAWPDRESQRKLSIPDFTKRIGVSEEEVDRLMAGEVAT